MTTAAARLKDWIPIILTTLAIAGSAALFVFKTNDAAGKEHSALEEKHGVLELVDALQKQETINQKERFDDFKNDTKAALRTINRNLRRLAGVRGARQMEEIPE